MPGTSLSPMTVQRVIIIATEPMNANRSPAGPATTRPSTVKNRHCRTARGQSAVARIRHGFAAPNSRKPSRTAAPAMSEEIKGGFPPGAHGHPLEQHRTECRVQDGQPQGGDQRTEVDVAGR